MVDRLPALTCRHCQRRSQVEEILTKGDLRDL